VVGVQLTNMIARELRTLFLNLKKSRWDQKLKMLKDGKKYKPGQDSMSSSLMSFSKPINQSNKRMPYKEPKSKFFFAKLKENDVLLCLKLIKENNQLIHDYDEMKKTPLHWACQLAFENIIMILLDFGACIHSKDDFNRKPDDEIVTNSQTRGIKYSLYISKMVEEAKCGTLTRNTKKYEEPLYVKYLTPVEQIKELADFIYKMNDMSTLAQP
jgi:ankyrin repeat protein